MNFFFNKHSLIDILVHSCEARLTCHARQVSIQMFLFLVLVLRKSIQDFDAYFLLKKMN